MNSDTCPLTLKSRLIFPNISMLDLSNNQLKKIPASIYKLSNLSVLNVAGNTGIIFHVLHLTYKYVKCPVI